MVDAPVPPDAHGFGRGVPDRAVPPRLFLGVGVAVLAIAAVYWLTASDETGTALLALAAVLSLWCGAYLWLRLRASAAEESEEVGEGVGEVEEPFLPHSSPWPFAIGVGSFLLGNGLLVGGWFFLPGAAILTLGVGGFVRESRLRL